MKPPTSNFQELVSILAKLRGPGGCPWDQEQTFESIIPNTLEEADEVVDAIRKRDFGGLCEELGDLLLQVLFYAQMAKEEGHFTLDDVLDGVCKKLIRRHPHVFRTTKVSGSDEVLKNWKIIKRLEKDFKKQGRALHTVTDDEWDELWKKAKQESETLHDQ